MNDPADQNPPADAKARAERKACAKLVSDRIALLLDTADKLTAQNHNEAINLRATAWQLTIVEHAINARSRLTKEPT